MTCIAGLINKGEVYMGADSLASDEAGGKNVRKDQKIFPNGEFLLGGFGSWRVIQVLRFGFTPPPIRRDLFKYMATDFMDNLKNVMAAESLANSKGMVDKSGMLVACRGRLFTVMDDWQVQENADGFDASGTGEIPALAALYATRGMHPRKRLLLSLEASARYCTTVAPPFICYRLDKSGKITKLRTSKKT